MRRLTLSILLALAASGVCASAEVVDDIAGLQAWYKTDSLHGTLRNGDRVATWPDSSGSGRDLVDDQNGLPSVFEVRQIGDHAVVRVGKGNTHTVQEPFEMEDHTLFLVYEAARPQIGLFQGAAEGRKYGVVLRKGDRRDICGRFAPYGRDFELKPGFNITVLGRHSGQLHAFVNGENLSSGETFGEALQVGRLFRARLTRYVIPDGVGLRVAEMMFYDRFLGEDERDAITGYLSEKYAIGLTPAIGAILGTTVPQEVNLPAPHRVEWQEQTELRAPMSHDAAEVENTELRCTRDDTTVRLSVSLTLSSQAPGTKVRVAFLKNDEVYLSETAETGRMTGGTAPYVATVRLEATLTMNAGDFVEVVTVAAGEAGKVTLEPGAAELRAEIPP